MMKAISLWQPWASLLACGVKQYETRSWETRYRGPVAIHAAKKPMGQVRKETFPLGECIHTPDHAAQQAFMAAITDALTGYGDMLRNLPAGSIIATAELVDCRPMIRIADDTDEVGFCFADGSNYVTQPGEREFLFGDWKPGRYAWVFANRKLLPGPIPCRGHQGLWNWEDGV